MLRKKERRLSTLLGLHLFTPLFVFGTILLAWTYHTSIQAVDKEIRTSFELKRAVAQTVLENRRTDLTQSMSTISEDEKLQFSLFSLIPELANERLQNLAETSDTYFDILFVTDPQGSIWIDSSSGFFDIQSILPVVAKNAGRFLASSFIIRTKGDNRNFSLMLRTLPLVHQRTGRVLGELVGGIILDSDISLMKSIQNQSSTTAAALLDNDQPVSFSSSFYTDVILRGRSLLETTSSTNLDGVAVVDGKYLIHFSPIAISGRPTHLTLALVAQDHSLEELQAAYTQKAAILFVFLIIFILFTNFMVRRVTISPLKSVLTYSHRVANEDVDVAYTAGPILEFNELGRTMESMIHKLQKSRRLVRNILDSMPSSLVAVNEDGTIIQWNRQTAQKTGITEDFARGKKLGDVIPELAKELNKVHEAIRTRSPQTETNVPRRHGDELRFETVTVYPLVENGVEGAVIRVDDITEKIRMEEMLIQSEKMLSVGGLAAGMAHEINNPLAAIVGSAQNISKRTSSELAKNHDIAKSCDTTIEAVEAYLQTRGVTKMVHSIHNAGVRAAAIVSNMLSFSRKSSTEWSEVDLAKLLDQTVELAATDYNLKKDYDFRKIQLIREYEPSLPDIYCAPGMIQQVLLNLLRNAAQAMRQKHYLPEESPRFILRVMNDRNYVRLEVEDNGTGMTPDIRKRVFEPFYTTKPVGTGTGLGLSVSYFIITEEHRGEFWVESTPDQWAKFVIRLPKKKPSN